MRQRRIGHIIVTAETKENVMKRLIAAFLAGLLCLSAVGCSAKPKLSPDNPVNISIWTYYSGDTLTAFNELISRFNRTVGKTLGVFVSSSYYGSVDELETAVLNSAAGNAGAANMPNIFLAYADTADSMDQLGLLVDISEHITDSELDLYIESYLREGDFAGTGELKLFPTAKSTELLFINKTDWDTFAHATGASLDDLATTEGLIETAAAYYEWTDSLTDTPNDGKAFFGYDAMDNYLLIGALQLGTEIFRTEDGTPRIDFDRETIRKLWDSFYVPYVKGYYSATGRFRSDDVKTGDAIAYVGSSAGATYFPKQVIISDTDRYSIEMIALPSPYFEDGEFIAAQQGAGMAVTCGTDLEIAASIEFLKWFTAPENNIAFSVNSGYLPVTRAGNDVDAILASDPDISESMAQVISVAVATVTDCRLYTSRVFAGETEARNILKRRLSDQAIADRAAVLAACAEGLSMEDALARYLSDENFNSWYEETNHLLQACIE